MLTDLFATAPERDDLIVSGDQRISTAAVVERAQGLAAAFNARGIGHGDHVAFQMPNGIDAVALYRACWRIGAVAVPVHPGAGTARIAEVIDQSHPSLLVGHRGSALRDEPAAVGVDDLTGGEAPAVECRDSDDALVMFTSGSTARPKGVIHTHAGLVVKTLQIAETHGLTTDDCVHVPAVPADVPGLLHGVLVPAARGAKTVLMERWNPEAAPAAIEDEQVTWMVGPPTFFIDLMDAASFDPRRAASLRLMWKTTSKPTGLSAQPWPWLNPTTASVPGSLHSWWPTNLSTWPPAEIGSTALGQPSSSAPNASNTSLRCRCSPLARSTVQPWHSASLTVSGRCGVVCAMLKP